MVTHNSIYFNSIYENVASERETEQKIKKRNTNLPTNVVSYLNEMNHTFYTSKFNYIKR